MSFIFDVLIIQNSDGKFSLDDVMKHLYEEFYQKKKGVSEQDYMDAISLFAGSSVKPIFDNYVHNTSDYTPLIHNALDTIGLKLTTKQSDKISQSKLGIKTQQQGNYFVIKSIYPNSPADACGLMLEDELYAVQAMDVNVNLDAWLAYFNQEELEVMVKRKGVFVHKKVKFDTKVYYPEYSVTEKEEKNENEKKYFNRWSN